MFENVKTSGHERLINYDDFEKSVNFYAPSILKNIWVSN